LFLDGGLDIAKKFIMRFLQRDTNIKTADHKSSLQEFCQCNFSQLPKYKLIKTEGPDHNKLFEVSVSLRGKVYGVGFGHSKKEAQAHAAQEALETIKNEASFENFKKADKLS
jgi:ribonuclease-3